MLLGIETAPHNPERCGMIPSSLQAEHAVCGQCGQWTHQVTLDFWQCLLCGWFGRLPGGPSNPPDGLPARKRRRR